MTLYTRFHLGTSLMKPLIGLIALLSILLTGAVYMQWSSSISAHQEPVPHWAESEYRRPSGQNLIHTSEQAILVTPWEPYTPRNSTLGFEAILALSKSSSSWRRQGLLAAAQVTDMSITIPPQPNWSKELADAFEVIGDEKATKPQHGSALAWLAHIDMLKYIIQSGLNSALVLEDDVDWDVNIKDQMTLIATAVRNHTNAPDEDIHPYSHRWDVLWIGHCGDNPMGTEPIKAFDDPTVVPESSYKGWARTIFSRIKEGQRAVYKSNGAVCTFAYAVNKSGAQKVLNYVSRGQDEAFDIKLMHGCQADAFRCIVVNPEVMRHFRPDAQFGQSSEVGKANNRIEDGSAEFAGDREDGDFGPLRVDIAKTITGTTENIKDSTRCYRFFKKTCLAK